MKAYQLSILALLFVFQFPAFAQYSVTFRVNMSVKIREGTFQPQSGDIVRVAANFNDWGNSRDTLRDIVATDSIYEKEVLLPTGVIQYKFLKTLRSGLDWEADPNRTYTVTTGIHILPVEWFDRDSVVSVLPRFVPVTFRVNMRVKILEGSFVPLDDGLRVVGSFNGWGTPTDTLRKEPPPNDSVYRVTKSFLEGDSIWYTYLKTLRGGIDWESVIRRYRIPFGGGAIPLVYFDDDSIVNIPPAVPVVFRVNMRVKILEGTFQPHIGDRVRVAGSFNGWNANVDTLLDADNDSIYTKAVQLVEGSAIAYKFIKTPRGGLDWESDPNRTYTVPTGGGVLQVVWFDRDSVVNTPVNANIRWQVDMGPFMTLGWFSPALHDTVELRGQFNNWGSPRVILRYDFLTLSTYFVTLPYVGTSGDMLPHKFYLDLDSATAVARFPNWNDDREGHNYEHPYLQGDGTRRFIVNTSGNVTPGPVYFDDIRPQQLMLNTTDTCRITVRVNMGPATRMVVPFNPATDTVKLEWKDPRYVSSQVLSQGIFARNLVLQRVSPTDSIWSATFRIRGKTHNGMMYLYTFTSPLGYSEREGPATLGAPITYRVRYIQPLAPNVFPPNYSAPLDTWLRDVLPIEPHPFIQSVEEDKSKVQPTRFVLDQNYPNPFNPATRISYSIPQGVYVSLRVFDLVGREVATLVNEQQPAGNYIASFEGDGFSSGVYFYRLVAGNVSETKKMLLLR